MKKVIIIGQAPPKQKQTFPYDTTYLYDWLSDAGIDKEKAQTICIFEACYHTFLGTDDKGNHKKPTYKHFKEHWRDNLRGMVKDSTDVILLGGVARDFVLRKLGYNGPRVKWGETVELYKRNFTVLLHPSKRNYSAIQDNKDKISKEFKRIFGKYLEKPE